MPALRTLTTFAAIGLALACGACGRRGALEPPDAAAAPLARPAANALIASPRALPESVGLGTGSPERDPDAVLAGDQLPASATPATSGDVPITTARGAKRGYVIPKQPFILDPIL